MVNSRGLLFSLWSGRYREWRKARGGGWGKKKAPQGLQMSGIGSQGSLPALGLGNTFICECPVSLGLLLLVGAGRLKYPRSSLGVSLFAEQNMDCIYSSWSTSP